MRLNDNITLHQANLNTMYGSKFSVARASHAIAREVTAKQLIAIVPWAPEPPFGAITTKVDRSSGSSFNVAIGNVRGSV